IPQATPEDEAEDATGTDMPARRPSRGRPPASRALVPASAQAGADPWTNLLQTGLALLTQVAASRPKARALNGPTKGKAARSTALSVGQRDERTGESYLKLPMPSPQVLEQAAQALAGLLGAFRH